MDNLKTNSFDDLIDFVNDIRHSVFSSDSIESQDVSGFTLSREEITYIDDIESSLQPTILYGLY